MKIETITFTLRKNLGNYEHLEVSVTSKVEDNEEASIAMHKLKQFVAKAVQEKPEVEEEEVVVEEVKPEPVVEAPKKEKKAKKEKAPVSDETSNIPAIPVEEVKPVGKNVEVYNSNLAEHKSIFAGYLAKKYDNSWKTAKPVDEIKSFTASLNGKHFLDNDGKIVESFLNLVHEFFGA